MGNLEPVAWHRLSAKGAETALFVPKCPELS